MDQFEKITPEMLNDVAGGTDLNELGQWGVKAIALKYKKQGKTKEETKAILRPGLERQGLTSAEIDTVEAFIDGCWDSL